MEQFTVKDFLTYRNPCFLCGTVNTVRIGGHIPSILPNYMEIDLKINYSNAIKLFIFHKTNKILSNNKDGLTQLLESRTLNLSSFCFNCSSNRSSEDLVFDLNKDIILPVKIAAETLYSSEGYKRYELISNYRDNRSFIHIWEAKTPSSKDINKELSLIPSSKFKTKEQFIEKMKLYALFS